MLKLKSVNIVAILLLLVSGKSIPCFGDVWRITQISDSNYGCVRPSISGTNVVWEESVGPTHQIFFCDGNTITQVTNSSRSCREPRISGTNVAWHGRDVNDNDQIFFWDGNTITQITNSDTDPTSPSISGTIVGWRDMDENNVMQVFLWDGSEITQLTNSNKHCTDGPSISDTNVVWSGLDANNVEQVFLWDGSEITQVTDGEFDCLYVAISGTNVVWVQQCEFYNNTHQVMLWDGLTTTQLTYGYKECEEPSISGTNVVWSETPRYVFSGVAEVYFWDGTKTSKLITSTFERPLPANPYPSVSGTKVVWSGYDSRFTRQIFMAEQVSNPETCAEALGMGYSIGSDLSNNCKVDLIDFALLANDWLRCIDPNDPNCERPWE